MAKQWKSLWDDSDDADNGPDGAKQPRGPRPNPQYRGDAAEDEFASDDYGGYGWSGNFSGGYSGGSYRYSETLDDSDERWYRKSSFRYGKHADYSPSSLFRSAFQRSYSSTGVDNEATNKAIRALRNLTRSANTIVDKSVGNDEFAVQFSSGENNNGALDQLNDNKQRIVFVSPDALLESKTTEDEDSVVDALTGFVLLRVQMAQDVATDVIAKINGTGAHLVGLKLATRFSEPGAAALSAWSTEDLADLSAAAVDEYLAGMLAKSMLMRLARRKVVLNWGGFAPYFIRHAKKFAAVKTNLEAAALSVESVVAKLGYNMLADEEPIAIEKQFEDIATKHLGAEVEVENLLAVCAQLVADIRAAMKTDHPEAAAGEMESAVNKMLADAQAAQKKGASGNSALKEFFEKLSNALLDAVEGADAARTENETASAETDALNEKLKRMTSAEKLAKSLADTLALIKELGERAKHEDPTTATRTKAAIANALQNLPYKFNSRPKGVAALAAAGLKPSVDAVMDECGKAFPETEAEQKAIQDKLEKLAAEMNALVKDQRAKLKEEVKKTIDATLARSHEIEETGRKLQKEIDSAKTAVSKDTAADTTTRTATSALLTQISEMLHELNSRAVAARPAIEKAANTANSARSASTLEKASREAQQALNNAAQYLRNVTLSSYGWYSSSATITQLVKSLDAAHKVLPRTAAVEQAVDAVLNKKTMSQRGFAAAMAKGLGGGGFEKMLADAEDGKDSHGIDADTLAAIKRLLDDMSHGGVSTAAAEKIGASAAEKLEKIQNDSSPVDDELFGNTVKTKTRVLTGEAISRVNDEARNDPEEEYIAYLSGDKNAAKPKTKTATESARHNRVYHTDVVKRVRIEHRGSIERVRNALQFQSGKRTAETFGLLSGDLDEGSLHKLSYDCDHIWAQKTVSRLPDVAVGILVDQSGSMSGAKIDRARQMCIILAEALKKIAGVRLYVYGHTANTMGADLLIYEHYTPTNSDITRLGGIAAHSNNYDGYAIKDVAKRLALDPAKRKYLFTICDGLPSGQGYNGPSAEKHVTSVCKFVRNRLKINVNAFAVGVPVSQQNSFKKQYGDDHVVFIEDIMKCLPQIVRFLRNALQKERKLVGIED
jgi:uncharacterized protein with von Willebrand factor type A (vWA) domain